MARGLQCWQCGGSLREVPRPIRRHDRCPACRADLHACRLCRHYAPKVLGECLHERAERVVDKTAANFCTHFRPRPGAHAPPADGPADRAKAELAALFGTDSDETGVEAEGSGTAPQEESLTPAERARRELDALFGLEPGVGSTDEEPSC